MRRKYAAERGFTLLETLIALGLMTAITLALTSVTIWIFNSQADNSARINAVRQVENAIHWFNHDGKQAQEIDLNGAAGFPLELTWTGWDGTANKVTYTIDGENLIREYQEGTETLTVIAAEYVDSQPGLTFCSLTGNTCTITLTVTTRGAHPATETRAIEIYSPSRVN